MLENLGLTGGIILILLGSLLLYSGMYSLAADATLKVIGDSVMFALGLITVATVSKWLKNVDKYGSIRYIL